jgi:hypothetical protein
MFLFKYHISDVTGTLKITPMSVALYSTQFALTSCQFVQLCTVLEGKVNGDGSTSLTTLLIVCMGGTIVMDGSAQKPSTTPYTIPLQASASNGDRFSLLFGLLLLKELSHVLSQFSLQKFNVFPLVGD